MCEQAWLRRSAASRAVALTPKGRIEMKRRLGLDLSAAAIPDSPPLGATKLKLGPL
jgi:hypothetical protein